MLAGAKLIASASSPPERKDPSDWRCYYLAAVTTRGRGQKGRITPSMGRRGEGDNGGDESGNYRRRE